VDSELGVMDKSVKTGHETQKWQWFFPLPHGAWDREGALIAEALTPNAMTVLTELLGNVVGLERLLAVQRANAGPDSEEAGLAQNVVDLLLRLSAEITAARRFLRPLAYPNARDLDAASSSPRAAN
jgi:hypothetical protein